PSVERLVALCCCARVKRERDAREICTSDVASAADRRGPDAGRRADAGAGCATGARAPYASLAARTVAVQRAVLRRSTFRRAYAGAAGADGGRRAHPGAGE